NGKRGRDRWRSVLGPLCSNLPKMKWDPFTMVHFTVVSQLGSSASDSPFFGVACSAWSSSAANALSFFVEVPLARTRSCSAARLGLQSAQNAFRGPYWGITPVQEADCLPLLQTSCDRIRYCRE